MPNVDPPRWTEDDFEEARTAAIEVFRRERMEEDLGAYSDQFDQARDRVAELLELTVDLTQIEDNALDIVASPDMLEALRYLAGPPISLDDLKVLADTNTVVRSRLASEPWRAAACIETIMLGIDRNRFPWVSEERDPDAAEREAAIISTAALIAQRRTMTSRANESKDAQEQATAAALVGAGFHQVAPRTINTFTDAPSPGQFCHESMFGGRKADLVVRLWDGRGMPIECKVSNSSTNSVKRLNNDAAVKATHWLQQFGTSQTVPTAVLAGVFKVHNLVNAQSDGLTIFWAHDLDRLVDFVNSTR